MIIPLFIDFTGFKPFQVVPFITFSKHQTVANPSFADPNMRSCKFHGACNNVLTRIDQKFHPGQRLVFRCIVPVYHDRSGRKNSPRTYTKPMGFMYGIFIFIYQPNVGKFMLYIDPMEMTWALTPTQIIKSILCQRT